MQNKHLNSQYFLKEVNAIWRKILHLGRESEVAANTVLPKSNLKYFSFLDSGRIRLESFNMHGGIRFIKFFDSGCIIGETAAFQASDIISCSLVTLEPCTIFHFDAELLKDENFIKEYPELIINLLDSLTLKLTNSYEVVSDSSIPKPKQAICRFLDSLADKKDENSFYPGLTQDDIAFTLGYHRSTVCKMLKELRKEEILGKFDHKQLEIFNKEKLQQYAKGE